MDLLKLIQEAIAKMKKLNGYLANKTVVYGCNAKVELWFSNMGYVREAMGIFMNEYPTLIYMFEFRSAKH